jgi:hypothetical protein
MANTSLNRNDTYSAINGVSITTANATYDRCRGIWIGTTQSLDFSFDGTTWVTFQGCAAGSLLPFQVVGARKTTGSADPSANDVIFLY